MVIPVFIFVSVLFFLEINIEPPIWKITHDEDDEDDDNVH